MAPPQENPAGSGAGAGIATPAAYRVATMYQTSEPKRMRISSGSGSNGRSSSSSSSSNNSTKFTRAATGTPSAMTNKGSVYKAQRGKAVTAAMVKAKTPTTHRRRGRKGKSVYRGVCVTREGKWRAVIYKERKQLYLGVYESEVDAAKAHDRAARFHFAENAVCNFDNEHEADQQVLLHKQRQLVQQQQVADERAHQIALHGGGFVAGREEFDDLEEYHRGLDMEGASCSEEGEGEEDMAEGEEDMSTFGETRSNRSFSTSSATSFSTGSMMSSDDGHSSSGGNQTLDQEKQSTTIGNGLTANIQPLNYARPTTATGATNAAVSSATAAAASAAFSAVASGSAGSALGAGLHHDGSVNLNGGDTGLGHNFVVTHNFGHHHRGMSAGSAADSDSDFTPMSSLVPDLEPTPLEGMGFPYAEDLLGYEMQSWYSCQDDDDLSPTTSASSFGASLMTHKQHQRAPQQGLGAGWAMTEFGHSSRQVSSSSMSSSMSGFSSSCDEDYVPSALPPLMGMCAEP